MNGLLQDLRYAVRQLRKSPGFAITAVLSLTLGIGATTAIFSVVYSILLDPYPYRDADRMVHVELREAFQIPNINQALGRTFSEGRTNGRNPFLVVGVVKDAKHFDLHEQPQPIFYSPLFQDPEPNAVAVYVRTRQAPEDAARTVRRAVISIDSRLVVDSLQTMHAQIDGTLTSERMLSFLASGFGIVAIFVTAIGLYGVLAYSIAQRTREIGIRMALGATRGSVVKMVLREVLILTGFSVVVALPLSIALSRLVRSQLFGISEHDPATLLLVTLAIGTVALLAAWAPARRATQVQPITALRYE